MVDTHPETIRSSRFSALKKDTMTTTMSFQRTITTAWSGTSAMSPKWCIWVWKQLGLAYGLKQAPDNVVGKGTYQQARKKLERKANKLDWGLPLSQLPGITWDGFQEAVKDGRQLIILSGMVYDIATFIPLHPGGVKILVSHIGKDEAFNVEIYSRTCYTPMIGTRD